MLTGNTLVFDIETVPDTQSGSTIYNLANLSEKDVVKAMRAKRIEKTGYTDFIAPHLHKIVAISVALQSKSDFRIWSIGTEESDEKELLIRFFEGLEKYEPTIVSWNGMAFDLPVIHYRSLFHGVVAPHYWDVGHIKKDYRFNNYISRFHWRHIDLMDALAAFQNRAWAPLDEIASMLGLPGKSGMSGSDVWDAYQNRDLRGIRNYCECDVMNTYLIYLRFEQIRGNLHTDSLSRELDRVKTEINRAKTGHLRDFSEYCDSYKLG
ncbi:MAG: 3'-5' exonuclease [Acidiferrobacteraceae bacterium]|nr:3'-5' exonuclease [Acidiferrobacteraceae bacterium]|tara:strand:- start:8935 stop:9729 length:795 start_codon:yes stop_codon:yes gene_type:complete